MLISSSSGGSTTFIPNSPYFILGRNTTNNTNITYGSNLVKQSNTNTSSYSHFYLMQDTNAGSNSTFSNAKYWVKIPIWNSSSYGNSTGFNIGSSLLDINSFYQSVGQEWSNNWGSSDATVLGYCLVYEISSDTWKDNGFG